MSNIVHVYLGEEDLGFFDFQKFTNSDAYLVENTSGLSLQAFFDGIGEMRPLALQTFIWLLRFKKGQSVDRKSIDFVIADLRLEPEPDPTVAVVGSAETSISEFSPTSAI